MRHMEIPPEVLQVISKLNGAGYEAYLVGGCVRDGLLGRKPEDWDITTSALPENVAGLFEKTVDTGLKHGTMTVLLQGLPVEVTTYRVDGIYTDSRRPESVRFTRSLEEDLARRDFTINAMAYHPSGDLIDCYSGIQGLKDRVIRTVGIPEERFREDALRMLRAVRFSSQLDFNIAPETLEAVRQNRRLVLHISPERIRGELTKLLLSDHPEKLAVLESQGLLELILPELHPAFQTEQHHPYHIYDVGNHTLKSISEIPPDPILRWTMLLHDAGKSFTRTTDEKGIHHFYGHPEKSESLAREALKRLRFDNKSSERILRLIRNHDREIVASPKPVRRAAATVGEDIFEDLLKVKEADMKAQNPAFLQKRLQRLLRIREIYSEIKARGQALSLKNLAVNGEDLLQLGFPADKRLGRVLKRLLEAVIENPGLNTREQLLKLARKMLQQ